MQFLRSLLLTILLFVMTVVFGVIVLVAACLPLSIHQRYAVPRGWAHTLLWLLKAICRLDYRVEGREHLPAVPFISMWKHSSAWETIAQMFLVPHASWSLKREILVDPDRRLGSQDLPPIAIDRGAGGAAVKQLVAQGRERLADGMGIVFYPEGTRVAPGRDAQVRHQRRVARERDRRAGCTDRAQFRLLLATPRTAQVSGDDPRRDRAAHRSHGPACTRNQRTGAGLD